MNNTLVYGIILLKLLQQDNEQYLRYLELQNQSKKGIYITDYQLNNLKERVFDLLKETACEYQRDLYQLKKKLKQLSESNKKLQDKIDTVIKQCDLEIKMSESHYKKSRGHQKDFALCYLTAQKKIKNILEAGKDC